MDTPASNGTRLNALRAQALTRLGGTADDSVWSADRSAALRVLYDLASSPHTAAGALALLQELQVHQVEMDLQEEELRASRAELEARLARRTLLFDAAPVAQLALDDAGRCREANQAAARLFNLLPGTSAAPLFEQWLAPASVPDWRSMLGQLRQGLTTVAASLHVHDAHPAGCALQVVARRDPSGEGWLVALWQDPEATPAPVS